jgi:CRP/FNR family transcriptional regulator, cyclic AMP receptor protein
MARDEYLQNLAAVPLFSRCSTAQLREIARVADELTVGPTTVLTRQGDIGVELFVIISGEATVTRDGQTIATIGAGDFVGELAVITRQPRTATVTAATELDLLVMTSRGLDQLLDDIPGLAKHLLYDVAERLTSALANYST